MNVIDLSPQQLRKAADIQERIQELQLELNETLAQPSATPSRVDGKRKNKMSAAGRAAISAAAKARWAKVRSSNGNGKPTKKAPKRRMTAAGKARIAAAVKARWAKAKLAGKRAL